MSAHNGSIGPELALDILVGQQLGAAWTGAQTGVSPHSAIRRHLRDISPRVYDRSQSTAHGSNSADRRSDYACSVRLDDTSSDAAFRINLSQVSQAIEFLQTLTTHYESTSDFLTSLVKSDLIETARKIDPLAASKFIRQLNDTYITVAAARKDVAAASQKWRQVADTLSETDTLLQRLLSALSGDDSMMSAISLGLTLSQPGGIVKYLGSAVVGAELYLTAWRVSTMTSVTLAAGTVVAGAALSAARNGIEGNWHNMLNADDVEAATGDITNAVPFLSQAIGTSLSLSWKISGRGRRHVDAITPAPDELASMQQAQAIFRARIAQIPQLSDSYDEPRSVSDLLTNAAEIDAVGQSHTAVVRVLVKEGDPPTFIVVIPSTKHWYSNSPIPNDLTSNIQVMANEPSALLISAKDALDKTVARYPASDLRKIVKPQVAVVGFSQGGITAAQFARQYARDFDVRYVVTAGAPVATMAAEPGVEMLSIENANDDIVPRLDLSPNRELKNHRTIHAPQGGHNALDYAMNAASLVTTTPPALAPFLAEPGKNLRRHDHYYRRSTQDRKKRKY